MDNDELITAKEVSERFGVCEATVWRWHREKRIPSVKIGRTVRFTINDIKDLMK